MNWKISMIVILAILGCVVSCAGITLCVSKQEEITKLMNAYEELQTQLQTMEEQYNSCAHDYTQLQVQLDTKQQELDALKKN